MNGVQLKEPNLSEKEGGIEEVDNRVTFGHHETVAESLWATRSANRVTFGHHEMLTE